MKSFQYPNFSAGESWFNSDRAGAPVFLDSYVKAWGSKKIEKFADSYYPFGDLELTYLFFKGERFYGRWGAMKKFGVSILSYLLEDDKNFEEYLIKKDAFIKDIDELWLSYTCEKIISMSREEAINFVLARQDNLITSWIVDAIAVFVGEIATPYMEWWFEFRGVSMEDRSELSNLIFTYPKISATVQRQLTIKKELDKISEHQRKEVMADILRRFAYAKSDFSGHVPYTESDVLSEYELSKSLRIETEALANLREQRLTALKLDPVEKKIFDIFAYCAFSRDERRAYQQRLFTMVDWSLEALSEFYKIPHSLIKYAVIDELTDENLTNPDYKRLLQERFDTGFIMYWTTRDECRYLTGEEASEKFDSVGKNVGPNESIKGQVAFQGRVTGKVRIILSPKALLPEDPFILVTSMTSPDYLQYMQKCLAIVTNEGGITCHAAILSRELKKPCIIGTKIATQVLKDGDLVEVDADNGVVRVIKAD